MTGVGVLPLPARALAAGALAADVPRSAMILAAGLGKRMRPLTATRPKPLIEIGGRTLLDRAIEHLRTAGVERVVVNVHYLADSIEAHLKSRDRGVEVLVSDEREALLDTGGGVRRALDLIDDDHFFVLNCDNVWVNGAEHTLHQLLRAWDPEQMDALLLLVSLARAVGYEGRGDFAMDAAGKLRRPPEQRVAPFVFSGIQLLTRRLFEDTPTGPFSLNRIYDDAMAAGRLAGVSHTGQWFHVGTPQAVAQTNALLTGG
jgi:MurNAc alpha-1-phosphate uridylyltransferase